MEMEPTGGLPPDRHRQLVLCNRATEIDVITPPTLTEQSQAQKLQQQYVKPTTLSLQPLIALQASAQVFPPIQTSNNLKTLEKVSSACKSNAACGSSTALASTATAISATTQAATAFSASSVGLHHQHHHHQQVAAVSAAKAQCPVGSICGSSSYSSSTPFCATTLTQAQTIEKLSRPMAFDKMEVLVREMQDQENGVPVRQQKIFLTSIPYAFMGYDLIEWLMDRVQIEESEALNIANQLCLHGYFFPVNDSKTLTVKDDSSLYRFQTPYYWPWQHKAPDNVEYAIYLAKRSLRNKQRHALEDYEAEALTSLHKNLKAKWDFISMQAEEQVRLAKDRKKGDKIVGDSQERAYWRVHRPPPGQFTPLEPCPIPSRDRQGLKPNKKKTVDDIQREVNYFEKSLNRTRMKMSQACESLVCYSETFSEYDFFLQPALPSNPWVTDDIAFWQLNSTFVDIPTEKRVKRWAISIEELVSDPTGLQEFTIFLEKEYSHENIRFWIAVNCLRRSAHSQVAQKVNEIFEEFLKPGAPCEINIDGKTMESVLRGLKHPSRFTFDSASEHIYMLLLKKDCYPRFVRSEHYKRLVDSGIQPSHKKRFFNFGGVGGAKKKMTAALSSQLHLSDVAKGSSSAVGPGSIIPTPHAGSLIRRRGSDRSLTGSAHELAGIGFDKERCSKVPHSHSQNNLCEIPYRVTPNTKFGQLESTLENLLAPDSGVCPWDELSTIDPTAVENVKLTTSTIDSDSTTSWLATPKPDKANASDGLKPLISTCPESCEVAHRMQRNLGIRHQKTVDSGEAGVKHLVPNLTEQRRASVSYTPSAWKHELKCDSCVTTTISPLASDSFPLLEIRSACLSSITTKDLQSSNDDSVDHMDNINKLSISERRIDLSVSELPVVTTPVSVPTQPPINKNTSSPMCSPNSVNSQGQPSSKYAPLVQLCDKSPTLNLRVNTNAGTATKDRRSDVDSQAVVKEVQIELIKPFINNSNEMQVNLAYKVLEQDVHNKNNDYPGRIKESRNDKNPENLVKVDDTLDLEVECAEAELSPTTDEYQEGINFGDDRTDAVYDYEIGNTAQLRGNIPPISIPAPSMAPLAVLDIDTVDDDHDELTIVKMPMPALSSDDIRRRRKKRNLEARKFTSLEEKDKGNEKASTSVETATDDDKHNAVCPWEDENVSTSDGTFVKTYSTLGYL
ncbi:uncharacterized protein LOC117782127 isoform X2 [Drosophila innubila]|uniref:uncharacterized protein LOC117782127 isoform X2 n=1 Tax=Drosophila innubila TaxID=198719 RepID=UPI00148DE115|nr:uncharacterized protein LOC117782127 isoform X2 [Drosophila innubila]